MMVDDWALPPNENQIRLLPLELLLIDWILCTGSSLMQLDTEELLEWGAFRESVWQCYLDPEHKEQPVGLMFPLSDHEAKTLLMACPTTFTWGDGIDYGLLLKEKLSKLILGIYTDPALTAAIEAEKKAVADAKVEAENKLKLAQSTLASAENAVELSKNTLDSKEIDAQRIHDDAVRTARETAKAEQDKVVSAKNALVQAVKEAKEYGISTDEDQADNQTQSTAPTEPTY